MKKYEKIKALFSCFSSVVLIWSLGVTSSLQAYSGWGHYGTSFTLASKSKLDEVSEFREQLEKVQKVLGDYFKDMSSNGSNIEGEWWKTLHDGIIDSVYIHNNEEKSDLRRFLQNVNKLEEYPARVLLGVSTSGVMLSAVTQANFKKAICVDRNVLSIEVYFPILLTLIALAPNRMAFLSLLSARAVHHSAPSELSVLEMRELLETAEPEDASTVSFVNWFLIKIFPEKYFLHQMKENLSAEMRDASFPGKMVSYLHSRKGFRKIKNMLSSMDFPESYLASEDNFQKLRNFILKGGFSGAHFDLSKPFPQTFVSKIKSWGQISGLYFSNLIDYFHNKKELYEGFYGNVLELYYLRESNHIPILYGSQLYSNKIPWNRTIREWYDSSS